MPPKSKTPNPPPHTRPYHISHPSLGHITGLTYLSPPSSSSPSSPSSPSPASTSSTPSSSTSSTSSSNTPQCHYIGGLPYALPPTGPYRFRPPRPLPPEYRYGTKANPGVFTKGAAVCPQPGFGGKVDEGKTGERKMEEWDENCLQLNVWIPAGEKPKEGWPVCVFLHGGFLQFGTPNTLNLSALLSETACRAIIVAPAYRVNVFGFLASHELASESQQARASSSSDSSSCSCTSCSCACSRTSSSSTPSTSSYHNPAFGGAGNYGFHDQRLALLWVHSHIHALGGNPHSLTLFGHSAGAHSTFHQLAHDIYLPPSQRLIKRALLLSNGAGMQPKSLRECQVQFDALLTALGIPLSLSASEKLERLRAMPARDLVEAAASLDLHEFRACSGASDGDGSFVRSSLFADIDSGAFARQLREAGVQIIIGEVSDEHWVYAGWRPPKAETLQAVKERLYADYERAAVNAVVREVYCPGPTSFVDRSGKEEGKIGSGQEPQLPTIQGVKCQSWREAFGRIYADLQVHALSRGFIAALSRHGAPDLVRRYRIEWRASCVERAGVPKKFGVTHGTDMTSVWFFGNGVSGGLSADEKDVVRRFAGPLWEWMCGRGWGSEEAWGAKGVREARILKGDGTTGAWTDGMWDEGVRVRDVARKAVREERGKGKQRVSKL